MLSNKAHKTALNNFYDQRYAGDYMDTDAYSLWGHGDLRTRQVADTLSLVPTQPCAILDYGCGVGGWISTLSKFYSHASISGVDVSSTAIEKAIVKYPKCHFKSFDGLQAPFADQEFDLIFSYHVLEHVIDFDASVRDIARMLKHGGHAVIIFPCGNNGSFLDRTMRLIKNAWKPTPDGWGVLEFEIPAGHVRRMKSKDTIDIFANHGLEIVAQYFSGHLFGTIDWLCRGTGPAYINKVFSGTPKSTFARIRLDITRRIFLATHKLLQRQSLDISKKRSAIKQVAVRTVRRLAILADSAITTLSSMEWSLFKSVKSGTAQYLIFRKI